MLFTTLSVALAAVNVPTNTAEVPAGARLHRQEGSAARNLLQDVLCVARVGHAPAYAERPRKKAERVFHRD